MTIKLLSIVVAACFIAGNACGQATLPPEGRPSGKPTTVVKLSRDARDFALDYYQLKDDVREILTDYMDYFSGLEESRSEHLLALMEKTMTSLSRPSQGNDPTQLRQSITDISALASKLTNDLGHSASERKTLKLLRTLQSDLDDIVPDLEDLIDQHQGFSKDERVAIGEYIIDSIADDDPTEIDHLSRQIERIAMLSARLAGNISQKLIDSLTQELEKASADFERSRKESLKWREGSPVAVWKHSVPPVPALPNVPSVPSAPPVPTMGERSVVLQSGDVVTVVSRLEDTLSLLKRQTPVRIQSKIGGVAILGVSGRTLSARCKISISAQSEAEARQASKLLKLGSHISGDTAVVTLDFPYLESSRISIASALLNIEVPEGCPIDISSHFGKIEARQMQNGISVRGDHLDILISESEGPMKIDNSMGMIHVSDCGGPSQVENSNGQIIFNNVSGDATIRNSFATTSISQCTGTYTLVTRGAIDVDSHDGSVIIDNSAASTNVMNVDGTVRVSSSFGSVVIENVAGGTDISSQSGSIRVENITGLMKVDSKMGSVELASVSGPLDIFCIGGITTLDIGNPLDDASKVQSNGGRLSMRISDEADIRVKLSATRGSTNVPDKLRIIDRGAVITAEGKWGSGHTILNVITEDAVVDIEEL